MLQHDQSPVWKQAWNKHHLQIPSSASSVHPPLGMQESAVSVFTFFLHQRISSLSSSAKSAWAHHQRTRISAVIAS